MKSERIKIILRDENPSAILHKNMENALIGLFRNERTVGVYSFLKFIESLVKKGATEEEALEIYDKTLSEAERSVNSPIWIDDTGV